MTILTNDNIIYLDESFRPKLDLDTPIIGPIESQMREKLSKLTNSQYPDEFDWSVYDRIASKFPEAPRGGVVFKTNLKIVNHHSTCNKCHYAINNFN